MAERIRIALVKDEWTPLIKNLSSRKVQKALGDAGNEIAHNVKRSLKTASKWGSITESIKVDRRGNRNMVNMATKGIMLDSMEPHYVSLKRGRNITNWVRRHYPLSKNPLARGRLKPQRIYKGKRGGLKGAIWVRPTPWIEKPMEKELNKSKRIGTRHINKLLRQAKTGG